jgi:hypothetical protein
MNSELSGRCGERFLGKISGFWAERPGGEVVGQSPLIRYVSTLQKCGFGLADSPIQKNATMKGTISYLVGAIMGAALQLQSRRRQWECRLENRAQPPRWRLMPHTRPSCSFLRRAAGRHIQTRAAADRVFSTQFSNCRRAKDLNVLNWGGRHKTTKNHGVTYSCAGACAITTVLGEFDLAVVNGGYGWLSNGCCAFSRRVSYAPNKVQSKTGQRPLAVCIVKRPRANGATILTIPFAPCPPDMPKLRILTKSRAHVLTGSRQRTVPR